MADHAQAYFEQMNRQSFAHYGRKGTRPLTMHMFQLIHKNNAVFNPRCIVKVLNCKQSSTAKMASKMQPDWCIATSVFLGREAGSTITAQIAVQQYIVPS
jgi:hypothetical protein